MAVKQNQNVLSFPDRPVVQLKMKKFTLLVEQTRRELNESGTARTFDAAGDREVSLSTINKRGLTCLSFGHRMICKPTRCWRSI